MKNVILKLALLALALSTTACVNTQSAPSMLDYSYVPPQYVSGGGAAYGIDDF